MFTLRRGVAVAAAVLLALSAAACESSDSDSSSSSSSDSAKIALLLPESQTTRYEQFDKPLFEAKVKAVCSGCSVIYNNANQQSDTQQQQAEAALNAGAKVLVLDPVDSDAAASIVATAKAKKVPVISYDRLISNADVDYYISYQNEKVGELQAQSLLDQLKKNGKTSGKIVMINGGPTDPNAKSFNKGAHTVFDKATGYTLEPSKDYFTPDWKPENAQTFMDGEVSKLGKTGFVGVYAANDGTAGGAIAAMKAAGINPIPPITGQDAELAAIQRILSGDQFMTVYKAIKPEAEQAAQLAVDLAQSKSPNPAPSATANNGKKDVKSILLTPVAVTKDNIKSTVVADGFWTAAQICTADYAAACKTAGLQ